MSGDRLLYFIIEAFSFLGCATFVLWYRFATKGKWKDNEAGVMLMMVYSDLALLLLWIMFTPMTVHLRIYKPITLTLFSFFGIFTWWPLRMLIISQKKARLAKIRLTND